MLPELRPWHDSDQHYPWVSGLSQGPRGDHLEGVLYVDHDGCRGPGQGGEAGGPTHGYRGDRRSGCEM